MMLSNMEVERVPQNFLTKIILANNMDTGKDWEPYLFGEFEWETWMRDLDSRVWFYEKILYSKTCQWAGRVEEIKFSEEF